MRLQVPVVDREVGRGHHPGQHGPHELLGEGTPVHAQDGLAGVEGPEEGEAYDVVPVGVGEDQVVLGDALGQERLAQPPDPGAGIHDDHAAVLRADLDTGGVAAVADVLLAADGDGPPRAPDLDEHGRHSMGRGVRQAAPRCGFKSSRALSISLSICRTSSFGLSNFTSSRMRSMKNTSIGFP